MFNSMSSEVRNLLLVASELGGEVTQYVKVLRKEKERLLPINEAQGEMEELVAERNQAQAVESNMLAALMRANDRASVAENDVASCRRLLDLTRAELTAQRDDALAAVAEEKVRRETTQADLFDSITLRNNQSETIRVLQGRIEDEAANLVTTRKELDKYTDEVVQLRNCIEHERGRHANLMSSYEGNLTAVRAALNKSESELREVHTKLEDTLEVDSSVKKAARQELGEVTAKYEKAQAKLLKIKSLIDSSQLDIRTVAYKAADGLSYHNVPRAIADAVASFIRTPIRHELDS